MSSVTFPLGAVPGPGEALDVAHGLLWIRMPLPMRPDHINIYAFDEGDHWSIVDTGLGIPQVQEVWEQVLAGPLGGKPIGRIVLTHHHPDHVGNVGWLMDRFDAELWTTRTAWLFARMLTLDEQEKVSPKTEAFWRGAGMDADILAERLAGRPFNFADVVSPLPLGFHRIGQDDEITLGGRRWRVEIGHGHAPEQATLWGIDHDLIIAGDQILPAMTPNLGVYATEPGCDTVGDWFASCRRLRELARPGHMALPGHRRPFTGVAEQLDEYIAHHEAALARLREFLTEPRMASDCFDLLYERKIGKSEYVLALGEAVGHLNHLYRNGEAQRWKNDDAAWLWKIVKKED